MENELNKAELKHSEAVTIQRTYNQIKSHLLSESLTYSNRLDELEKQIQAANEELKKLKIINKDAFIAKENVSNEYSKFEDKVYRWAIVFDIIRVLSINTYLRQKILQGSEKNAKFTWRAWKKRLNKRNYKRNESIVVWY